VHCFFSFHPILRPLLLNHIGGKLECTERTYTSRVILNWQLNYFNIPFKLVLAVLSKWLSWAGLTETSHLKQKNALNKCLHWYIQQLKSTFTEAEGDREREREREERYVSVCVCVCVCSFKLIIDSCLFKWLKIPGKSGNHICSTSLIFQEMQIKTNVILDTLQIFLHFYIIPFWPRLRKTSYTTGGKAIDTFWEKKFNNVYHN
jgi:hypothetical protein